MHAVFFFSLLFCFEKAGSEVKRIFLFLCKLSINHFRNQKIWFTMNKSLPQSTSSAEYQADYQAIPTIEISLSLLFFFSSVTSTDVQLKVSRFCTSEMVYCLMFKKIFEADSRSLFSLLILIAQFCSYFWHSLDLSTATQQMAQHLLPVIRR